MAGPLVCDLCDDPADRVVMMVTITANGDTIALGEGCTPAWAIAAVEMLTGIVLEAAAPPEEAGDAAGSDDAPDVPDAPVAKRNGRRVPAAPAAPEPEQAEATAAAD